MFPHDLHLVSAMHRSNIYPPAPGPSNYRYAPPASRAMAAHSYVPAGRTRSMTPSYRTRSNDIDDPYDGLPPPELHRAASNNTMSTPPPRRLLSPHQGVRRRSEVCDTFLWMVAMLQAHYHIVQHVFVGALRSMRVLLVMGLRETRC